MTTLELPPYPLAETAGPGNDGDPDEVLLVVGDWWSRCSACGRGASLAEHSHRTELEDQIRRGCGRAWTGVAAAWDARAEIDDRARRHAELLGLPFVGRRPAPGGAA